MKKALLIAISLLMTGCQTTPSGPNNLWKTVSLKDDFTDGVTKMVTIGENVRSGSMIYTQSLKYYPFVGIQDGEVFVGVRSGGAYRIPTGTVQLRIDEEEAWTIGTDETPLSLAPKQPNLMPSNMPATANAEAQKMYDNIIKMSSPYTAATGEKAKKIIKQMVRGKKVKYRSVGINQAASTTGEVVIDASFIESLKAIGIDPATL
jgi:hypothetical protein